MKKNNSAFALRLAFILFALLFVISASPQDVTAQESTQEPTIEPTATDVLPTSDPTIPVETIVPDTIIPTPTLPESTAEVTAEPQPTNEPTALPTGTLLDSFFDNFEAGTHEYWAVSAWEIMLDGTNHELVTSTAGAAASIVGFSAADLLIRADTKIQAGSTLTVTFGAEDAPYRVMLSANGTSRLSRGELVLDGGISPLQPDTQQVWFTFEILTAGQTIAVSINQVPVIVYTDEQLLSSGAVTFLSTADNTGSVHLDNVLVSRIDPATTIIPTEVALDPTATAIVPEITPEVSEPEATDPAPEATAEVTPEPEATAEVTAEPQNNADKLQDELAQLLEAIAQNPDQATEWFSGRGYLVDRYGRIGLSIKLHPGSDEQLIADLVNQAGGTVVGSNSRKVDALVPLNLIAALIEHPSVRTIERLASATSTGPSRSPAGAPSGTIYSSGVDTLGFLDWHQSGITGSGIRVGIVDIGFEGLPDTDEFSCLKEPPLTLLDISNHGLGMIEIICDIAPNAEVYGFELIGGYSSLTNVINNARALGINVLVIAVDLGAHESPGDGEGGSTENSPYIAMELARSEGMVIVAAAGNNGINTPGGSGERVSRYGVLTIDATPGVKATVQIHASAGDNINISWNDWEPGLGLSNSASIEDFNITLSRSGGSLITDYLAARTSILDNPSAQLFVAATGGVGTDFCAISGTAIGNGDCDLLLEIERVSGDSTVVMQIQIAPESVSTENQGTNLQITGYTGLSGATVVTDTGTLARPADSPAVIAVGAVCSNDLANYVVLPDSSVGPIFGPNGSVSTVTSPDTRSVTKPELISISPVSTNTYGVINNTDCDGTIAGLDAAGGFGGTSAAAAHIGGLAALILSNPNSSGFFTKDELGVQRLTDYLQRHSADLPLLDPDGLDFTYGAGLAQLGAPTYNPANAQNVIIPPNLLSCSGSVNYVGQGNVEGPWDGSLESPYLSIGHAVNSSGSGDCIVVMPGEYVSPVYIGTDNLSLYSYNSVSTNIYADTVFRVGAQYFTPSASPNVLPAYASSTDGYSYMQSAAIYLDGADGTIIDGFRFIGSLTIKRHTIDDAVTLNPYSYQRNGIYSDFSSSIQIRNNVFGDNGATGVSLPSWNENGNPIIIDGGSSTIIQDNLFVSNIGGLFETGADDFRYAASAVVLNAGSSGAILFRSNEIRSNETVEIGASINDWAALIYGNDSYLDIVGNEFVANQTTVVVGARTDAETDPQQLRVVSNVFLNNTFRTESSGASSTAQPGPLVQTYFVSDLAFINNTVARNNLTNSGAYAGLNSGILGRGDRTGNGLITDATNRTFDFANNLIYRNTMSAGAVVGIGACDSLLGGSGSNNAARANWWHSSGITGAICATSFSNAANRNITTIDPTAVLLTGFTNARSGMFGVGSATLDPLLDPLYYGLGIAHPNNAVADDDDFYHVGVDYSNLTTFGASIDLTAAPFNLDVYGEPRISNIGNWEVASLTPVNMNSYNEATGGTDTDTYQVDIGAYEFNRLRIVEDLYSFVDHSELIFSEDPSPVPYIIINMEEAIQGGFGRITFSITSKPDTFGIQCGSEFTVENKGMFVGTGTNNYRIFYCPPADFYTEEDNIVADPFDVVPDFVAFDYEVSDEAGLTDAGQVNFSLAPTTDPALAETIGDGSPDGDDFIVTGNIGSTLRVALRPFVRFDNFLFSEAANEEFLVGDDYMIQYPYTYGLPVCTEPNPAQPIVASTPTWIDQGAGIVSIVLSSTEDGEVECDYDVTDADGNTVPQVLRVRAVTRIPNDPGLYDDSSFAFEYLNASGAPGGTWQPVEDETAINNTLHRTTVANERTTFGFRGAAFTLHMFGDSSAGGFWDMNIYVNGSATPLVWDDWNLMPDSTLIYQRETSLGDFVCTTSAVRRDPAGDLSLSNTLVGTYTVNCVSYTSSTVKIVEIINRDNGRRLTVDAFTLHRYSTGDDPANDIPDVPLAPGTYYISHPDLQTMFAADWIETASSQYAGGIGYVSKAVNPSNLAFRVYGGTGVAIGTTLESLGASFRLCVTNQDTSGKVCQNHDTSPETKTPFTARAYFPIFGLDQYTEYLVEIQNIQTDTAGKMVIDSVVVFGDTSIPLYPLIGEVEDDRSGAFFFGSGREDTWTLNTAETTASNQSLTSIRTGQSLVGPFIAFQVGASTHSILWTYQYRTPSQGVMVCADRGTMVGTTTANSHGNCLLINLSTGTATQILANGSTGASTNVAITQGTIAIHEDNFREPWASTSGTHTIEIFSVRVGPFTMDKVVTLDTSSPLEIGRFEEYVSSAFYETPGLPTDVVGIAYLSPGGTSVATITKTTNTTFTTYPATGFTHLTGAGAARDSGGGIMYTRQVGAIIQFRFSGTGFAPYFRLGTTNEAIRICYLAGTQTAVDTLATGSCTVFDNQNTRSYNNVPRPIMGLQNGTYTVAMQYLGDNFSPANNPTSGEQLWFDGVRIYANDLTTLTPLQPGTTYESSYVNRTASNQFAYFGTGWASLSGTAARQYSGQNVDSIARGDVGATIAFRVANSTGIELIRVLNRSHTAVLVCAINEATGTRSCHPVSNDGTGFQNRIPIQFGTTAANYRVTVTALDGIAFFFDAVRPIGQYTPLTQGLYEESNPSILYNYNAQNLIFNGNMEEASGYWTYLSSASGVQSAVRYLGSFSRQVTAPTNGAGIRSATFQLVSGERYTLVARVRIDAAAAGQVSTALFPSNPDVATTVTTVTNQWVTIRKDFVATSTGDYSIQFTGTPNSLSTGMRFLIDDVSIINRSSWSVESNNSYTGTYAMTSRTHGSEFMFAFQGTGFSLGVITGQHGGEMQICWQPYTPPTLPAPDSVVTYGLANSTCITYENESLAINTVTQRVIAGLSAGTYAVVVRDVEDGNSTTAATYPVNRPITSTVGTIKLDYIRILNEDLPAAVPAGTFSEADSDTTGARSQLSLQPPASWGSIIGNAAARFSNQSFVTVIDPTRVQSKTQAGPVAILPLDAGGDEATVILDVQAASRTHSNQLLACVGPVNGIINRQGASFRITELNSVTPSNNCVILSDMTTSRFVTINSDNLDAMSNPGTSSLILQALTPGTFQIDGYQVIYGTELQAGYYEETIGAAILNRVSGTWTSELNASYSGGRALVLNNPTNTNPTGQLTFDFSGTGFSLVTASIANGGTVQISLTGASSPAPVTLDTRFAGTAFGTSVSITGLPAGSYTATISVTNSAGEKFVLDAIRVYGDLQQLGSLYDDALVNDSGVPYITYGPAANSWTTLTGRLAAGALNETLHQTRAYGAVASFEIGNTSPGFNILFNRSKTTAPSVSVCFRNAVTGVLLGGSCQSVNLVGSTGRVSVSPSTPGNYTVSIINDGSVTGLFTLDAIQILENGLYEGIYDAADLDQRTGTDLQTDGTFNSTTNTLELSNGEIAEIRISGIALSILIDSASGSSTSYSLCAGSDSTFPFNGTCNLIASHTLPLAGDTPTGISALTYTGLHSLGGQNRTFIVRLTNLSAGLLRVKGLHVLGDSTIVRINDTERYENDSPQLQYLPFGSLLEITTKAGQASELTEHSGKQQGSAAYFEFIGTFDVFEYFRQRATANGTVEICYGVIGQDTLSEARAASQCATVNNSGVTVYRYGTNVPASPTLLPDCSISGCWALIRNREAKSMPVDYIRLYNDFVPIEAGQYEDSHPAMIYINGSGNSAETWQTFADARASGGAVRRITVSDADNDLTNGDGPVMTFWMRGTGFSIQFTGDLKADAVSICYLPEIAQPVTPSDFNLAVNNTVNNGQCQRFDNESRTTTYGLTRTVMGLPFGNYRVTVQMLTDAGSPAYHAASALPLTMQIDSVQVIGTDWASSLVLGANQLYENNYNTRETNALFTYTGSTWQAFEGNSASRYSGRNYDTIRSAGSGITFQTLNVDAITLYTDLRRGLAPLRMCATPLTGVAPSYSTNGETVCEDFILDGAGNQRPLTFRFTRFRQIASNRYVVSIMTLDNNQFFFDAIQTHTNDTAGNLLTTGIYQETHQNLFYDQTYSNLVVNGSMEQATHWYPGGTNPANLTSQVQNLTTRYQGRASWSVRANNGGGIKSEPMVLDNLGEIYTVVARVFVTSGSVRMKIVDGSDPAGIVEYRDLIPSTTTGTTSNRWATLRADFRLQRAYSNVTIQFEATSANTQFLVDDVSLNLGSTWSGVYATVHNGGSIYRSNSHGATMYFSYTGTGFQLGTYVDTGGGEMEICYDDDTTFDDTADLTPQSCFTYQQETTRSQVISRTISGLPLGTYHVRVRDVEDGRSVNVRSVPATPRSATLSVGRLAIDYVRVLSDTTQPIVPPGYYDDIASDPATSEAYLQLEPQADWGRFSGTTAKNWRGTTFTSVIDQTGRSSTTSAGQTANIFITVPVNGATVILYTNPVANTRNSAQVLVCAGNTMSGEITWDGNVFSLTSPTTPGQCVLRSMATSNKLVISSADLVALGTPSVTPVRVSFTTLTTGDFSVDAFQVIHGSTLAPGIYDDILPDVLLDFDTNQTNDTLIQELPSRATTCNLRTFWCEFKSTLAYGGSRLRTQNQNATLRFNILGSGFSILTGLTAGADMRICYGQTPSSGSLTFPTLGQTNTWNNATQDLSTGGIWCDVVTTNTTTATWNQRNPGRINPVSGEQYGFAYYGLPYDEYTVEVRMIQSLPTASANSLSIDAVVVFENHDDLPILYSGFYDNTQAVASISLEPETSWSELTSRTSPPRGPYNFTEMNATNAGSIAQVHVSGNAVTLYQSISTRGSRDVRVCMPVTDAMIHCTSEASINASDILDQSSLPAYALAVELANFNQNGRTAFFLPVMFYGLGAGEHELIFENRDHGRIFSIDAIEVHD